jgi:hypothetical protein
VNSYGNFFKCQNHCTQKNKAKKYILKTNEGGSSLYLFRFEAEQKIRKRNKEKIKIQKRNEAKRKI